MPPEETPAPHLRCLCGDHDRQGELDAARQLFVGDVDQALISADVARRGSLAAAHGQTRVMLERKIGVEAVRAPA